MGKFWSALVGKSVLSAKVVLFESGAAIQILARHKLCVFWYCLKNKMNGLNMFVIGMCKNDLFNLKQEHRRNFDNRDEKCTAIFTQMEDDFKCEMICPRKHMHSKRNFMN
jgi:hypothetical protein